MRRHVKPYNEPTHFPSDRDHLPEEVPQRVHAARKQRTRRTTRRQLERALAATTRAYLSTPTDGADFESDTDY